MQTAKMVLRHAVLAAGHRSVVGDRAGTQLPPANQASEVLQSLRTRLWGISH